MNAPARRSGRQNWRKPPKPQLGCNPDLTWSGSLERQPDGVTGRLLDRHGWHLVLGGADRADGGLELRASIGLPGTEFGPWVDGGLRVTLTDAPEVVLGGDMHRRGRLWIGWLGLPSPVCSIELEAEPEGPGRLILRGRG